MFDQKVFWPNCVMFQHFDRPVIVSSGFTFGLRTHTFPVRLTFAWPVKQKRNTKRVRVCACTIWLAIPVAFAEWINMNWAPKTGQRSSRYTDAAVFFPSDVQVERTVFWLHLSADHHRSNATCRGSDRPRGDCMRAEHHANLSSLPQPARFESRRLLIETRAVLVRTGKQIVSVKNQQPDTFSFEHLVRVVGQRQAALLLFLPPSRHTVAQTHTHTHTPSRIRRFCRHDLLTQTVVRRSNIHLLKEKSTWTFAPKRNNNSLSSRMVQQQKYDNKTSHITHHLHDLLPAYARSNDQPPIWCANPAWK